MEKKSRKCILCPSHTYHYCGRCTDEKVRENWRNLFDTENCRDVYHVISEFAFGRLSANDAKNQLDKLEIPNKDDIQPALRKNLEDLYAQVTITEPVKDNSIEISVPVVEEQVEEKPVKPRRRRAFRRSYDE